MKITTAQGEHVFSYEDDRIVHGERPRVEVYLVNVKDGTRVTLEIELDDLSLIAGHLCEKIRCGICDRPLWTRDDGRWNHEVGHICTDCEAHSDHPAAQMHRSFAKMAEERIKERKKP